MTWGVSASAMASSLRNRASELGRVTTIGNYILCASPPNGGCAHAPDVPSGGAGRTSWGIGSEGKKGCEGCCRTNKGRKGQLNLSVASAMRLFFGRGSSSRGDDPLACPSVNEPLLGKFKGE